MRRQVDSNLYLLLDRQGFGMENYGFHVLRDYVYWKRDAKGSHVYGLARTLLQVYTPMGGCFDFSELGSGEKPSISIYFNFDPSHTVLSSLALTS